MHWAGSSGHMYCYKLLRGNTDGYGCKKKSGPKKKLYTDHMAEKQKAVQPIDDREIVVV